MIPDRSSAEAWMPRYKNVRQFNITDVTSVKDASQRWISRWPEFWVQVSTVITLIQSLGE